MKKVSSRTCWSILFVLVITALSCEREDPDTPHPVSLESLSGWVQKGPFINGTSVNVAELSEGLIQSGKNFSTQISDNRGSFELRQLELSSQFVELKADGFYFNEISGSPSSARLVLYALSDLSDKTSLNVNLISHLERDRVYQLISEGLSFHKAKQQALQEILEIFSIEKPGMQESEELNITSQGDDHAILLAVSVILQGYRSVAELSELLANLNSDFKEDGELNSTELGSALINHAVILHPTQIRENLEARYSETGLDVDLPDFEKYLTAFIENCEYEITSVINYPEFSPYGENILFPELTSVLANQDYSLAAVLPEGTKLKIKLSGGLWHYRALPNGPINWSISNYDFDQKTQIFTSQVSGELCDLSIHFSGPSMATDSSTMTDSLINKEILVEYFENLSEAATWSKVLSIADPD